MLFYKLFSSFKTVGAIKDVNYKTLNINILTFRQNIKNLVGNFRAINVRIMHAKLNPSSFNGMGGE